MAEHDTIATFLDGLASAAPTPGGGGAAAISGAMGAALVSMVCNLTIGKKKYVEVEAELEDMLAQSEALRAQLTGMIAEDVAAFDAVMGAYGLPKATDEEKAARAEKKKLDDSLLERIRAYAEEDETSARIAGIVSSSGRASRGGGEVSGDARVSAAGMRWPSGASR